jgi:spermidine synthase
MLLSNCSPGEKEGNMNSSTAKKQLWFTDRITEHEQHHHEVKKWITHKKNDIQQIAIAELFSFGKCLIIDDDLQSCETDEFIYHEALVHPAMILHGKPSNILILGGGEGATLREVLKYKPVTRATMVDIDDKVVNLCRKYMPSMSDGAFDDTRTELLIEDAIQYIRKTRGRFDVIISDLSSPIKGGPAYQLYTKEFYLDLKKKLAPSGIFSTQVDSCSPTNLNVPVAIYKTLGAVFSSVRLYTCYIPSFDSLWGFIIATDWPELFDLKTKNIDRRSSKLLNQGLKFYDGETHNSMFSLPKYLRRRLKENANILTAKNPIFIYK